MRRNEWRREVASAQAWGILNLSQEGFGPKPGITNVGREGGKRREGGKEGGGREGREALAQDSWKSGGFLQRVKVKRALSHRPE